MNVLQKNMTYPHSKWKKSFTRRWTGWKNIYKKRPAEKEALRRCMDALKRAYGADRMITEKEVAQAIEECMREPVTGNKRAVLADLIIIQDYLFVEPMQAQ